MRLTALTFFATVASFAVADISFTSPADGTSITAGGIDVQWKDSGTAPALSDLISYQLFLCAGGDDASTIVQLATLVVDGLFTNGNLAQAAFSAELGASTPKNA
jgi:hypothetical protein